MPEDCNYGNNHALMRGKFKIYDLDKYQMRLICTTNFELNNPQRTIELVNLNRKSDYYDDEDF